jgi:hypothetical protein
MRLIILSAFCFFLFDTTVLAQPGGCTDPQAVNFNPGAKLNDGTCQYNNQLFSPEPTITLPSTLHEISGMVYWNGLFWGHNDGDNGAWFYAFDTTNGSIKKVIGLTGASNNDWEDMAQDSQNIYIGDFGNNEDGNRKNLSIYAIPKDLLDIPGDTIRINNTQFKIIQYSYPDQVDFSPTGANNTRFDCESMFFHRGRLHLITKNWIGDFSVHYSLPTLAGNYTATRHDSLNTTGFLITGADIGAEDQIILTAYSRSGACAFFLIYGFGGGTDYFVTGNKRKINLPWSGQIGQLEAVCYINGIRGAIGSERFRVNQLNIDVPQNTMRFTTNQWVLDHYKQNTKPLAEAGMMRYNADTGQFEFFDGLIWQLLSHE